MMTNTFTPLVGGVARSVESFTQEYRARGHRVLVVAPEFENSPAEELDVVRVPAIQHFNGSDFSVVLPIPGFLTSTVEQFAPDVVHSHHPFLLGATAVRLANERRLPLVFTHHTLYEHYTHYSPGDSAALKRFVVELSTQYANLCDVVLAPSESVKALLIQRGVECPIRVNPTGIPIARFANGSGTGFRAAAGIPADAFLIGHVGRLAPEKNIEFLTRAVSQVLEKDSRRRFLVVGRGPSEGIIQKSLKALGLSGRLHLVGTLEGPLLASAYGAMDLFVFASKSETQGMVLVEAMAAGVPVVALDAPGVREVVADHHNGRLLHGQNLADFVSAATSIISLDPGRLHALQEQARLTARRFSIESTAAKALSVYEALTQEEFIDREDAYQDWRGTLRLIKAEWNLLKGMTEAAGAALTGSTIQ